MLQSSLSTGSQPVVAEDVTKLPHHAVTEKLRYVWGTTEIHELIRGTPFIHIVSLLKN